MRSTTMGSGHLCILTCPPEPDQVAKRPTLLQWVRCVIYTLLNPGSGYLFCKALEKIYASQTTKRNRKQAISHVC